MVFEGHPTSFFRVYGGRPANDEERKWFLPQIYGLNWDDELDAALA